MVFLFLDLNASGFKKRSILYQRSHCMCGIENCDYLQRENEHSKL